MGCFPVYSPMEIYHAAGFLPVGLVGGGELELTHADARFQSFICSIAKSTLELALQGRLQGFDAFAFHSICDVARNLAAIFTRNLPHAHVEYIHLPQGAPSEEAQRYLAAEFRRVRDRLSGKFRVPITDDRLRASVRTYNRARAAMRSLNALRAAHPERLAAADAFLLLRAGMLVPVEEWTELLAEAGRAAEASTAKARDHVRVVIEGAFCEPPPADLIENIERAGCYVLDDDLLAGWNWFEHDVSEDGDPMEVLASAYLHHSRPSSTRHDPSRPREEELVARARRLGAQAVLFLSAKFCEPALLDYVLYRRELAASDLPHLKMEFEEKMWTFERPRGEVETFVESILFE